jgi:hypothetical protein
MPLFKQIGKILRSINEEKPIKLQMSGLIAKGGIGLDYVLAGLKSNKHVEEVNLSQNNLDDEDLARICERLALDQNIKKIKVGYNNFTDPAPFCELLRTNG